MNSKEKKERKRKQRRLEIRRAKVKRQLAETRARQRYEREQEASRSINDSVYSSKPIPVHAASLKEEVKGTSFNLARFTEGKKAEDTTPAQPHSFNKSAWGMSNGTTNP